MCICKKLESPLGHPTQVSTQVQLSWWLLAITCESGLVSDCVFLRSLWSRPNLHATRRKFFIVWPESMRLKWPISQWNKEYVCLGMSLLRLARKLESTFGNSMQVSTLVRRVTAWSSGFDQGFVQSKEKGISQIFLVTWGDERGCLQKLNSWREGFWKVHASNFENFFLLLVK